MGGHEDRIFEIWLKGSLRNCVGRPYHLYRLVFDLCWFYSLFVCHVAAQKLVRRDSGWNLQVHLSSLSACVGAGLLVPVLPFYTLPKSVVKSFCTWEMKHKFSFNVFAFFIIHIFRLKKGEGKGGNRVRTRWV